MAKKQSRPAGKGTYQSKKNPIRPLMWVTVAVIALFLVIAFINKSMESKAEPIVYDEMPSLDGQPLYGESGAPVTVVEFGDYKCPSCKYWDENIFPKLKADYIDSGKVNYTFINTLFHGEESVLASLASETALAQYPEHFWDFHHALFAAQPSNQNAQWVTMDKIRELAENHIPNIDIESFMQALTDKTSQAAVNADDNLVERYKVQLTPTIMVNNVMMADPFDYDAIRAAIEERLAASQ